MTVAELIEALQALQAMPDAACHWIVRKVGRDEWLQLIDAGNGARPRWVNAPEIASTFNTKPSDHWLSAMVPGVALLSERCAGTSASP